MLFSAFTLTPSSLNIPARSLVNLAALNGVIMVAFSSLSAKPASSLYAVQLAAFFQRSRPTAKSVATELVEVSSPFSIFAPRGSDG